MSGGKAGQPPAVNSAAGAANGTQAPSTLPAQPLAPTSSYAPMPKPAPSGATGQEAAVPQTGLPPQESQIAPTPTNPNAAPTGLTGANQAGDVWAPGTGPGGGYNTYGGDNGYGSTGGGKKGGQPPSWQGAQPGSSSYGPQGAQGAQSAQAGQTGQPSVGGGWQGASPQQPGGAGAFGGQFDAIKNKLGTDAAQTFAVKNWGSGGKEMMEKMYAGDSDAYNAAINAHGAGGVGTGIQGQTVVGPDGQRYQVGDLGRVKGKGSNKANQALWKDQNWLNQNAVKL